MKFFLPFFVFPAPDLVRQALRAEKAYGKNSCGGMGSVG
jgi:hypothetical protein